MSSDSVRDNQPEITNQAVGVTPAADSDGFVPVAGVSIEDLESLSEVWDEYEHKDEDEMVGYDPSGRLFSLHNSYDDVTIPSFSLSKWWDSQRCKWTKLRPFTLDEQAGFLLLLSMFSGIKMQMSFEFFAKLSYDLPRLKHRRICEIITESMKRGMDWDEALIINQEFFGGTIEAAVKMLRRRNVQEKVDLDGYFKSISAFVTLTKNRALLCRVMGFNSRVFDLLVSIGRILGDNPCFQVTDAVQLLSEIAHRQWMKRAFGKIQLHIHDGRMFSESLCLIGIEMSVLSNLVIGAERQSMLVPFLVKFAKDFR